MSLLLDTHALTWFLENDTHLSMRARATPEDAGNRCHVSDAAAWESGIKHAPGKLDLPVLYEVLFTERLESLGFHVLPIRHAHPHQMVKLPKY